MENRLKNKREALHQGKGRVPQGERMTHERETEGFSSSLKKRIRLAFNEQGDEEHSVERDIVPNFGEEQAEGTCEIVCELSSSNDPVQPFAEQGNQIGSFTIVRQERRGGSHGKGGRKPGKSAREARLSIPNDIARLIGQAFVAICDGTVQGFIESLKKTFQRHSPEKPWSNEKDILRHSIEDVVRGTTEKMYEIVGAPIPTFTMKLPYSQTGAEAVFAKDKHVVCCWINPSGRQYCSCFGSTQFRISTEAESSIVPSMEENITACVHIRDLPLSQWLHSLPCVKSHHSKSVALLCQVMPGHTSDVQFIPMRLISRGSRVLACAFCDTVEPTGCYHVSAARRLLDESNNVENDFEKSEQENLNQSLSGDSAFKIGDNHKSVLPLSPLSCRRSVHVDELVGIAARRREPYILSAPLTCHSCGEFRNPKTRGMWEGVVMCTLGPCILQVETFRCSNQGCVHLVEAEGRDHCILIGRKTAATHVLLRRELLGVVMSNGTLNSRLRHYHSQVLSLMESGVLPMYPRCRSTRTLQYLSTTMLKLMTIAPDKSLFLCCVCDSSEQGSQSRRVALCIDGIYQGYLRRKECSAHWPTGIIK